MFRQPPPIPATILPRIMTHSSLARPHIRLPAAKKAFEYMSPVRRENISVSLPESGCSAALAIRYDEANHERSVKELKDVEMGAERVATMVESALC